jgi:hypothetical protein
VPMKPSLPAAALSFALFVSACATPATWKAAAADYARVRSEIMPLFTAMQEAANVHDAEAHMAPFVRGPSLTFVVNGRVIRGYDDLLTQQRKWWPEGMIRPTDEAHQPYRLTSEPTLQLFGPRLAMLTFVLDSRRVYPGRVMRRPLAISQLWEKRDGRWKIVHVHESMGPERPES